MNDFQQFPVADVDVRRAPIRTTAKPSALRANTGPSRPKRRGARGGGFSRQALCCCWARRWEWVSGSTPGCMPR